MHQHLTAALLTCTALAVPALAQDGSIEASTKARAVLEESARAYQQAPAIVDVATLTAKSPMGEEDHRLEMAFGAGTDAMITLGSMEVVALGDSLYVTMKEAPDKYFATKLEQNLEQTLSAVTGGAGGPLPVQFAMRADRGMESYVEALGMGFISRPQITAYDTVEHKDGARHHRITLSGSEGTCTVHIDAASNLLSDLRLVGTPPGAPEGFEMTLDVEFDPKVKESPEGLVRFDSASLAKVDDFEDLFPRPARPVRVGDIAPDFTLQTLSGQTVTLSDLQGDVVVLDFWATWCGPCRRALPLLQAFHEWTVSNDHPVKVYAVNVWEREPDAEAKKKKASAFWTEQKYTMPSLFAPDDTVPFAYGLQGIPLTVIIGRDGVVTDVHSGYDAKMTETLKADVGELLETEG